MLAAWVFWPRRKKIPTVNPPTVREYYQALYLKLHFRVEECKELSQLLDLEGAIKKFWEENLGFVEEEKLRADVKLLTERFETRQNEIYVEYCQA